MLTFLGPDEFSRQGYMYILGGFDGRRLNDMCLKLFRDRWGSAAFGVRV